MQAIQKNTNAGERIKIYRTKATSYRELEDFFSYLVIEERNRFTSGDNKMPGKIILMEEKEPLQDFSDWQLPKQPTGYIKSRRHDFL